jgi:ABC-type ATPase involved in cell division
MVEHMNARSEALFVGGRSGAGKSSVGNEIHAQLSAAEVWHCLIDGDFLDLAHPSPWEHGLAERNLAAMWATYRDLGHRRMIYTNTATVLEDVMDRLTVAMDDAPKVTAVLLSCTDETARRRLSQREIGSALDRHLERSAEMARALNRAPSWVHRVPTDDRSVTEIATEIIGLAGWLPQESQGH